MKSIQIISIKKEDVLKLFKIIENYFELEENDYLKYASEIIDLEDLETSKKRLTGWGLSEAQYFAFFQPTSNKKVICQNLLWYLDGIINAKNVAERIGIEIPIKE